MLPRIYLCFIALNLLFCGTALAQPTCFTNYDAISYCEFSRSSTIIVVGTVKSLTPDENYSMLHYREAVITVSQILKGRTADNIKVELPSHCAGSIHAGGTYIFNIEPESGTSVLRAHHWSTLEDLPKKQVDKLLDGLRSVLAGIWQPRLTGVVRRPNGDGFNLIKVTAKNDISTYTIMTNAAGEFTFAKLPKGRYQVSAAYPLGFQPNDNYDQPREKDDRDIEILGPDDWPCTVSLSFYTSLSAKITGSVSVEKSGSAPFPYFQLVDAARAGPDDDPKLRMESFSYPPTDGSNGPIGFRFHHVPPGKYLVRLALDRSFEKLTTYYYPGVRSIKDAKVIEIEAGKSLDLKMKLPTLGLISITGMTKLADGRPIFGGVAMVDAEAPTVTFPFSPWDRDRDDIKFVFRFIKGRRAYLCAGYDGIWHGKQIRLYGKLGLDGETDRNDVVVTLDKPIPTGVYWWDQCRKDR